MLCPSLPTHAATSLTTTHISATCNSSLHLYLSHLAYIHSDSLLVNFATMPLSILHVQPLIQPWNQRHHSYLINYGEEAKLVIVTVIMRPSRTGALIIILIQVSSQNFAMLDINSMFHRMKMLRTNIMNHDDLSTLHIIIFYFCVPEIFIGQNNFILSVSLILISQL